ESGKAFRGIPTGIEIIDIQGIGWTPGEFSAIIARPGVGKSWLTSHIAVVGWLNGARPVVLSPEMSRRDFSWRMDSIAARLMGIKDFPGNWEGRKGEITPAGMAALREYADRIKDRKDMLVVDNISRRGRPVNATDLLGYVRELDS